MTQKEPPSLAHLRTSRKTDEQWIEEFAEEFGRAPDAQELHDWMNRGQKPVNPAKGNELLKKLFSSRPLPIVHDPEPGKR